jgi:hypothetical protein
MPHVELSVRSVSVADMKQRERLFSQRCMQLENDVSKFLAEILR